MATKQNTMTTIRIYASTRDMLALEKIRRRRELGKVHGMAELVREAAGLLLQKIQVRRRVKA
jgi:hypothetical protein